MLETTDVCCQKGGEIEPRTQNFAFNMINII